MSTGLLSVELPAGEHLIIPAGALVFYIDDSGDQKFAHPEHPFLAFGGVACTCEFHITLAENWKHMKAATFRQVRGPLHANRHLRRNSVVRWQAVSAAMSSPYLGRF